HTPRGTENLLHGLKTYVTAPSNEDENDKDPKGVVVIAPDALGWTFCNTRLLADRMAEEGGHAPSATLLAVFDNLLYDTGIWNWLWKPYYFLQVAYAMLPFLLLVPLSKSLPRLRSFLAALRTTTHPTLPLGACGYCWGAKHVITLASESISPENETKQPQQPLLTAAFVAHPASDVEVPGDFDNLHTPLSTAVGEKDIFFSMEVVERVKGVLATREEGEGLESEVCVYAGARHGFATRGDDKVGFERRQAEEAREQAVAWLGRWFKRGGAGM
ncbi:MAG: hypothetical protein LQ349_009782, partial [Xanthoria aureola]